MADHQTHETLPTSHLRPYVSVIIYKTCANFNSFLLPTTAVVDVYVAVGRQLGHVEITTSMHTDPVTPIVVAWEKNVKWSHALIAYTNTLKLRLIVSI